MYVLIPDTISLRDVLIWSIALIAVIIILQLSFNWADYWDEAEIRAEYGHPHDTHHPHDTSYDKEGFHTKRERELVNRVKGAGTNVSLVENDRICRNFKPKACSQADFCVLVDDEKCVGGHPIHGRTFLTTD